MGQAKHRGTFEERKALAQDKAMTGQIDILNCGAGHLEIRLNEKDPIELERGKRIVEDMLKRGYALFVHGKGDALIRVKRFDKKKGVYIIADGPTVPDEAEPRSAPAVAENKFQPEREAKMSKVKATVIGRSAGG